LIWVDVCSPDEVVPAPFKSSEFLSLIHSKLDSDGIVIANSFEFNARETNKLIGKYRREFQFTIMIKIPGIVNYLVAASDQPLRCDRIRSVHKVLHASQDVNIEGSFACTEWSGN